MSMTLAEMATKRLARHTADTVAVVAALAADPATLAQTIRDLTLIQANEVRAFAAAAGMLAEQKALKA